MPLMPSSLTVRPPAREDVQAIFELLAAYDRAAVGFVDTEEADVVYALSRSDLNPQQDAWLVLDDGRLVAFAVLVPEPGGTRYQAEMYRHPDGGEDATRLIVDCVERRAAELAAGAVTGQLPVECWQPVGFEVIGAELDRRGWELVRRFNRMAVELSGQTPAEPVPADGVAVRAVVNDEDRRALHHVIEIAFADHFGHLSEPFEAWLERQRGRPGYDESVWLLAEVDGQPVAGLVGLRRSDDGWVAGVGTLPEFRGRGLGRLLLEMVIIRFHRLGHRTVALGVDTGKETGALRLYESVGMRPLFQADLRRRNIPGSRGEG